MGNEKHDKDKDLKQVRDLLARGVSSDSENERHSCIDRAYRLLKRHGLSQGEVVRQATETANKSAADEIAQVTERVKDMANTVRTVASDPDVKTIVGGVVDLFRAGANAVSKVKAARAAR